MRRPGPAHRLVYRELRARRRALGRIAAWSAVEALPSLLSGVLLSAATDRFVAHQAAAGLLLLTLLLPVAAAGAVATSRLFPWLAAVVEPVRDALLTAVVGGAVHAATRSPARADTAVVDRLTAQVQTVRNILFGLLRTVRQMVFGSVAALIGLAVLAPMVAVATTLLVLAAAALFALLLPGLAERHRAALLAREDLARRAGSAFGGMRDALACAAGGRAITEVDAAIDGSLARSRALSRATSRRGLVVFVGGQVPLVLLLATAPWLLSSGYLTVGEVVGAAAYLSVHLEPALRQIVGVAGNWGLELAVSLRRLGETFAEPAEARGGPAAPGHDLAVRGLTFTYGAAERPVVDDLALTLDEGAHLAVVGPSGAGKSTLANLLAGLLEPGRGTVRLGGVDLRDIRDDDRHRLIGLIPQEAYVFAGTLRDNLTYLAPHAGPADLERAVDAVGLRTVTDRLGGLDARVGAGGADLSHGEKQLVALARMYLSPARVLILDEATANLDPAAEARVEAAFAERAGTLVVIAHRITSARRARQVLLLSGAHARLGTHDDLLHTSSEYAELVGWWNAGRAPADGTPYADAQP
ncbi:ATP-binding cassette domain-containing protein [Krasilnikovia sp. MM14-A1259]|uniref:ATP-binding cassette domain-containing protein n=1 Tax=Krasilnikovia sp. MM14-A1259 TaxID=3373539 RepID=UPI003819964B